MAAIRLFKDPLLLDDGLIGILTSKGLYAQPGDTLVLGAKECTIAALTGDYNYLIVAERLIVPSGPIAVTGTPGNKSPSVTMLAISIDGHLDLRCKGAPGTKGTPGHAGTAAFVS